MPTLLVHPDTLGLVVDDHRFLLQRDNVIALLYVVRGYATKPYIATLMGPSGRNVLEDSPMDHVHHHGVWWGHGDVDGVDFYLEVPAEGRRLGRIEHRDFTDVVEDSPRFGFTERLEWVDDSGEVLIGERRSLLAHYAHKAWYTIDLDSTYTAERDLSFGTTKESVLPGIRVADDLVEVCGGTITSSAGGRGEQEVMGERVEWYDYSGTRQAAYGLGTTTEGIACFDHPDNPNHPNPVFVRAYGPTSPFQGHHFTGATTLAAGQAWRYRHRLLVHYGDTDEADVEGHHQTWLEEAR